MLLIKNIEYMQTSEDPIKIISQNLPYESVEVLSDKGDIVVPVNQITELVRGRRFRRPSDNLDIIIGLSRQASDVLGIQFEAWEAMEKELEISRMSVSSLNDKIEKAFNAKLWTRIKWVIFGYT